MIIVGFVLLGVGLLVGVMLALADPVLLSRINGEPVEGARGRFVRAPQADAEIVRLPRRESRESKAA